MCTMRVKVGRCCLCSILDLLGPLRADVRRNATLDCMLIRLVGPIHVMDLGATMHTARANTIEFAVTRRQRIYRAQRFGYSSVFIWKMVRVNQDHDAASSGPSSLPICRPLLGGGAAQCRGLRPFDLMHRRLCSGSRHSRTLEKGEETARRSNSCAPPPYHWCRSVVRRQGRRPEAVEPAGLPSRSASLPQRMTGEQRGRDRGAGQNQARLPDRIACCRSSAGSRRRRRRKACT